MTFSVVVSFVGLVSLGSLCVWTFLLLRGLRPLVSGLGLVCFCFRRRKDKVSSRIIYSDQLIFYNVIEAGLAPVTIVDWFCPLR
ncbi:hypothetical protein AtNW77_Chr1g0038651 [Arabidopsis thaliana]